MIQINSTDFFFVLGGYLEIGHLKYLYFTILAIIYVTVIVSNLLLIVVICMNRTLHEPMYLLLCSLFVNELYGATGLFPLLLIQVLSDVHTVSASFCFLQIFCIYTYGHVELCNLAVMSYDRYLAICCPLQYNSRMTPHRALVFIVSIWLYSFIKFFITLSLNLRLTLCGNVIENTYCNNYLIVRLSCSDTTLNNIYGLIGVVLTIVVPLLLILFSYLWIFRVCFSGSKQTRQKALSTCSPQLVSLINFSFGCFFEILQNRFQMRSVSKSLKIFLSLYFLIIQPILNPLIFGLQMRKLRTSCEQLFSQKNKVTVHRHI